LFSEKRTERLEAVDLGKGQKKIVDGSVANNQLLAETIENASYKVIFSEDTRAS